MRTKLQASLNLILKKTEVKSEYILPISPFTKRLCENSSQKNYLSDLVKIVKEIVKIKVL